MCGLAGILRFDDRPVAPERLEAMGRHLLPRGPDGTGRSGAGRCGLVHTRLAVVDPDTGAQPMSRPAEGPHAPVTVVFNGEIYNHHELRRELEGHGHVFHSHHSDTEVLLHGYRQWGQALPERLRGMFAAAVWDERTGALWLFRDRMGQKPLYIWRDGRRVVFASLIGALLEGLDRTPSIDPAALGRFLTLGYTGRRGLLQGVEEVPPAHSLRIGPDATERRRYWRPPSPATPPAASAADACEAALRSAVRARLEADVPLGCFLSGGVDSALVAAIAQEEADEPIRTFSVSMPDARYDEGPAARRTADALGTDHHELSAEPATEADLQRMTATLGEPFADSSILPTYWLSRATRRHVTAVLSGDGGDELFGGYERYRGLRLLQRHGGWLRHVPSRWIPVTDPKRLPAKLRRLFHASAEATPSRRYLDLVRLFPPDQLKALGVDGDMADMPDWPDEADPVEAARQWDRDHYLPQDLLRKVDRASMAVGLEVRCPLLDASVVELAAALPLSVLMPRGRRKGLLREVASRRLPPEVIRRPKAGFAVPVGRWLATHLRPALDRALLETEELRTLGFRPDGLRALIEQHARGRGDHTHRLFALLSLAMWLRWLRDPEPAATVASRPL